jgi:hypothetical protein
MKKMINLLFIILFLFQCKSDICDHQKILENYTQRKQANQIEQNESIIQLFSNERIIEKYILNKNKLERYNFYNHVAKKPIFTVLFNDDGNILDIKGSPFFIENSAFGKDTLRSDTLKVNVNAAIICGFETEINIYSKSKKKNKYTLNEQKFMTSNSFLLLDPYLRNGMNYYQIECLLRDDQRILVTDKIEFSFFKP